jgi:uncharacterized membrane-anchored protein YhcB (DUF1043 family)
MTLTDILFIMIFVGSAVGFLIGLAVGILHKRTTATEEMLKNNTNIKEITSWLRREQDNMLSQLSAKHVELSPFAAAVIVKVADEIEKRFIHKDIRG